MRFSVNIPCFGDFADPRTVARVATAAEEAGWDGLFVWDHLRARLPRRPAVRRPLDAPHRRGAGDLPAAAGHPGDAGRAAAAAGAGPPGGDPRRAHRRPGHLGVGLGGRSTTSTAASATPPTRSSWPAGSTRRSRLLPAFWSGSAGRPRGAALHGAGRDPAARRPSSSRGCRSGSRASGRTGRRCAGRRAGTAWCRCSRPRSTASYRRSTRCARCCRTSASSAARSTGSTSCSAGLTAPESAADVVGPFAEAGATWWDERQLQRGPDIDSLDAGAAAGRGGAAVALARARAPGHQTSPSRQSQVSSPSRSSGGVAGHGRRREPSSSGVGSTPLGVSTDVRPRQRCQPRDS